ncbi:hypothetical protein EZV73_07835 [Acidaminobacter sp. JC074]|uniref:N-acetylglucosamine kinase n=1 Tax=Acidaminobacter sp. JC074 TaxID=2530199 RepID=UPI001F0D7DA8|nr:hypothetical protein [Acidaminobacter sp. JC074]MCH4887477.1 hypothetical protein [Acidaminobacter sp. JC074]
MMISIDAGGSKCVGALIEKGVKIKTATSGFGNILVHKEKALNNILELIEMLYEPKVDKIVIGMAGAKTRDTNEIKTLIESRFDLELIVITDAELAYYDLLPQGGLLVIAGTGSVVLYKGPHGFIQAGGWGHLFGDEGSGYSLSVEAIKKVILCDSLGISTILKDIILDHYKLSDLEEVKFLYKEPKARIAELASVLAAYDFHTIDDLFIEESKKLGQTVLNMIKKYDLKVNKIGLTGGMIKHPLYLEALKASIGHYDYVINTEDHTLGGSYFE